MRMPFIKILFKFVRIVVSFSCITFSQANYTITIHYKYFSTTFSKSKRYPIVVKYWLTRTMFDCEHRV
jgi:hypothetical protein